MAAHGKGGGILSVWRCEGGGGVHKACTRPHRVQFSFTDGHIGTMLTPPPTSLAVHKQRGGSASRRRQYGRSSRQVDDTGRRWPTGRCRELSNERRYWVKRRGLGFASVSSSGDGGLVIDSRMAPNGRSLAQNAHEHPITPGVIQSQWAAPPCSMHLCLVGAPVSPPNRRKF